MINNWFQSAPNMSISFVSWRTDTLRTVVDNSTISVGSTITRVFALLVDASEERWAFLVDYALGTLASHVWVAQEALRAIALSTTINDPALSVDTTLFEVARVFTLPIDTSFLHGAVRIGATSSNKTLDIGVPDKAIWARAHRAMPSNVALCIGRTVVVDGAGILAPLLNASERVTALLIDSALRFGGCRLNHGALEVGVSR